MITEKSPEAARGCFTQTEYKYCLRCHRLLKTPQNRLRGFGATCYEKAKADEKILKKLF